MGSNPTLSAILAILNRPVLRILWGPEETWDALRAAAPDWRRLLFRTVAPLALIPALTWPLGHAADPIGSGAPALRSLAASSGVTFALCLVTVLIAAASIYVLAPVFSARRHWSGAVAVATYSSVPVLLASPLLASAVLTLLVVIAFLHGCVLCGIGLRRVLGCSGEDAPMYVAAAAFAGGLASLVVGGLSSAFGIL